ncbi:MAG: cytochrome c maturation protein CcmE [Trueperaceae bacterium]|nr:cytochrome c maturation protein CcmE [Trueperaceae bacterium]
MKRKWGYAVAGVAVLVIAGAMIYQALATSLVYFVLPNEYAAEPERYDARRLRLGGIVADQSVAFDESDLRLTFLVTDGIVSFPVSHFGAPPDLFEENVGVVIEGHFEGEVFMSDNVLVRHSEVYEAEEGVIDVEALRESLK